MSGSHIFHSGAEFKRFNLTFQQYFLEKLWTAPELLRAVSPPQEGTKKGDVYSFAIIAQEILYQRGVFYRTDGNYTSEGISFFFFFF